MKPGWIQLFGCDKFGSGSFSLSSQHDRDCSKNWLELKGEVQSCSWVKAGISHFWLAKPWRETLSFQLCYSMADALTILHAGGGCLQSHQKMKYVSLIVSFSWHHVYGSACRLGWTSRSSPSQLAKISSSFDVSTFCSYSELEGNQLLGFLLWMDNVPYFCLWHRQDSSDTTKQVLSSPLPHRVGCTRGHLLLVQGEWSSQIPSLRYLCPSMVQPVISGFTCILNRLCQLKTQFYKPLVKLVQLLQTLEWVSPFVMIIWAPVIHAKVTEQG